MSIIGRRRMLAIGLCCATTIITLGAGVQFATAQACAGPADDAAPTVRPTKLRTGLAGGEF